MSFLLVAVSWVLLGIAIVEGGLGLVDATVAGRLAQREARRRRLSPVAADELRWWREKGGRERALFAIVIGFWSCVASLIATNIQL